MSITWKKRIIRLALGGATFIIGLGVFDAANCGITNNLRTDLLRDVGASAIRSNVNLTNDPIFGPTDPNAPRQLLIGIWDSFVGSQIPLDPVNANALVVQ